MSFNGGSPVYYLGIFVQRFLAAEEAYTKYLE